MTEPQRLPDRWASRDFPVLLEVARALDDGRPPSLNDIASKLGLRDEEEARRALTALLGAGYLYERTAADRAPARLGDSLGMISWYELAERGRRAVGLWPDQDAPVDALVELLEQAASHVDDQDDAGNVRKAGRLLKSVPSAVIADVIAALVRQQTGL